MFKKPTKRGTTLKLLLLLIIFLAPFFGAIFIYQARDSIHFVTKNAGTLIQPSAALHDLAVENPEQKRWWLTYYTPNVCDQACIDTLNHLDTIQLSLSSDQHRIGTLLLTPNSVQPAQLPKYSGHLIYRQTDDAPLMPRLMAPEDTTAIWLTDPLGNIILRYDINSLDNRLLLDLRHLLKVSKIG